MVKINGKDVKIPEIDFGFESFLEDNGTPVLSGNIKKKPFRLARNCVAYALGIDGEDADYLLQQHVMGGGTLDKLYGEIREAIENSGFLKKMAENQKKKDPVIKKASPSEQTPEPAPEE